MFNEKIIYLKQLYWVVIFILIVNEFIDFDELIDFNR